MSSKNILRVNKKKKKKQQSQEQKRREKHEAVELINGSETEGKNGESNEHNKAKAKSTATTQRLAAQATPRVPQHRASNPRQSLIFFYFLGHSFLF
jgi:hypothetical protein